MISYVMAHLLVAHGPQNTNRDDRGRNKTAMVGLNPRLRISSQCRARPIRVADVIREASDSGLTRNWGDGTTNCSRISAYQPNFSRKGKAK